jgi:Immunity protein Imm1
MEMNNPMIVRLFHFTHDGVVDIADPPLSKVIDAIRALNGVENDTLSVTLRNGDTMDVGGGKDDQYKCHARTRGSFYDLVNPLVPLDMTDTVTIMMNQEANSFPRCCIVSSEMVMVAIESFCTKGELSSNLTWDNTLDYEPL